MKIKLGIIPKPPQVNRTVTESKVSPAFKDEGDTNHIYGNCGAIPAEKLRRGQIRNMVAHCSKYGQYNEFPSVDKLHEAS
jgi:hypothetical protein